MVLHDVECSSGIAMPEFVPHVPLHTHTHTIQSPSTPRARESSSSSATSTRAVPSSGPAPGGLRGEISAPHARRGPLCASPSRIKSRGSTRRAEFAIHNAGFAWRYIAPPALRLTRCHIGTCSFCSHKMPGRRLLGPVPVDWPFISICAAGASPEAMRALHERSNGVCASPSSVSRGIGFSFYMFVPCL